MLPIFLYTPIAKCAEDCTLYGDYCSNENENKTETKTNEYIQIQSWNAGKLCLETIDIVYKNLHQETFSHLTKLFIYTFLVCLPEVHISLTK